MDVRRWFRRALAALGIAAAAGCANGATPAAQVAPALWEVTDSDTRIYLFGTIHLLPKDYTSSTPELDRALTCSQRLIVGTLMDSDNPQALVGEMMRLGIRDGLPPLDQRVAPAKREALKAAVTNSGVPIALLDKMETWAAAMTLLSVQFRELGLQGSDGLEALLKQRFASANKPIGQLESNGEQLSFFDTLSEPAQRQLLEGAIEAPHAMRGQYDEMLRAWARGDTAAIARSFNSEYSGTPELLDALLARRNANWARWIEHRLDQPGTLMVAVGAGHLAGKASVQALLERRGYKVRRLQ